MFHFTFSISPPCGFHNKSNSAELKDQIASSRQHSTILCKAKFRITNWSTYNKVFTNGSHFLADDEAIQAWYELANALHHEEGPSVILIRHHTVLVIKYSGLNLAGQKRDLLIHFCPDERSVALPGLHQCQYSVGVG